MPVADTEDGSLSMGTLNGVQEVVEQTLLLLDSIKIKRIEDKDDRLVAFVQLRQNLPEEQRR